jgi:hypothetical protein
MSSVNSTTPISPIRLVRSSTDWWLSNRPVVKNGEAGSCVNASLSASDSTQIITTSVYRSPVSGSAASG